MTLLRYPYKIFTEETDYLQIGVKKYVPVGQGTGQSGRLTSRAGSGFRSNSSKGKAEATILLPIPSNIQSGNAVSYQESKVNELTAAIAGGAKDIMTGIDFTKPNIGQQIKKAGGNAMENIADTASLEQLGDLVTNQLASQAAGIFGGNISLNQMMARQSGQIFNPNMELLFEGPTLRSFKFSFKMTPRNDKESNQVKQILRTFKAHMAPKTMEKNLFIETPDIFELRYRKGGSNHPFLHKFKQCFLQDVGVNYTGDGTYATYHDGTPVSMQMDLTFKELEPIYDSDYKNDDKIGVGY